MKKFRIGLMILCAILILVEVVLLLFTEQTGLQRAGSVLTAVGLMMTVVSLGIGARHEKKQKTTDSTL